MKVRYTKRAFNDREQILEYLQKQSRPGARNVSARLEAATVLLSKQPLAGMSTDVPDVRVLFVGRYPYKVFYRVRGGTLEILHIRHTSRTPRWQE